MRRKCLGLLGLSAVVKNNGERGRKFLSPLGKGMHLAF